MRNVLFSQSKQGDFFEIAAGVAERQAERKRGTLAEIRKTLAERDVYAPYTENVSKFLTDQIEQISSAMDVDPAAYTEAASQYYKYYNMANQMKEFIRDAAASYAKDEQVNESVALDAMRKKYIQRGDIAELEKNVTSGIDAEQVLLTTPGALNQQRVLADAVKGLGETAMDMTNTAESLKKLGGYTLGLDTNEIKAAYSNLVTLEPVLDAKGNPTGEVTPKIKDVAELDRQGFTDVLLGNQRIDAVVTQALAKDGVTEIDDTKKKEKLRELLTPFVSTKIAQARTTQAIADRTPEIAARNRQLAMEEKRLNAQLKDKGDDAEKGSMLFQAVRGLVQDREGVMIKYTNQDYPKDAEGKEKTINGEKFTGYSNMLKDVLLRDDRKIGKIVYTQSGKMYTELIELNESGGVKQKRLVPFTFNLFGESLSPEQSRNFNDALTQSGLVNQYKEGGVERTLSEFMNRTVQGNTVRDTTGETRYPQPTSRGNR